LERQACPSYPVGNVTANMFYVLFTDTQQNSKPIGAQNRFLSSRSLAVYDETRRERHQNSLWISVREPWTKNQRYYLKSNR